MHLPLMLVILTQFPKGVLFEFGQEKSASKVPGKSFPFFLALNYH